MNKEQHWQKAFRKYLKGEASQQEAKVLDEFFKHHQQLSDTIWEEVGEPAEEIKEGIQRKIAARKQPLHRSSWYSQVAFKVAASFLLLLGLGTLLYVGYKDNKAATIASAENFVSVIAAPGQQKEVALPDGSLVKLNSDSELRYDASDFGSQKRRVHLKGEAFFQVKRDTAHPFIVETQALTTRVLGTSFNVNTHDDEYAVTVATGLVEVAEKLTGKVPKVLLHPTEKAVLSPATGVLQKLQHVALDDFAWTERILVFQDVPLNKAIARVERWYGVQITYDAELADRTITARYEHESLEHVMQSLSFLLGLSWEKTTPHHLKLKNQSKS